MIMCDYGNSTYKYSIFPYGYGSIPMKIPFLGGWTSILTQLFWCEQKGYYWFWHTAILQWLIVELPVIITCDVWGCNPCRNRIWFWYVFPYWGMVESVLEGFKHLLSMTTLSASMKIPWFDPVTYVSLPGNFRFEVENRAILEGQFPKNMGHVYHSHLKLPEAPRSQMLPTKNQPKWLG